MAHSERAEDIRRLIQSVRKVTVADLAARFRTSSVTIRKDLEALEKEGVLLRTHGGAVLAEDRGQTVPFSRKATQSLRAKERIADCAIGLLRDAQTVILDAGTTTQSIARRLADSAIWVITNSLAVANELSQRPSGTVIVLGGAWRQESAAFIGPYTLDTLDEINADVAFIGASGFTEDAFTCQNAVESQVKARIIARARRAYVVADSDKWGVKAFSTFARPSDVEALITDDGLADEARRLLEAAGTYVMTPAKTVVNRKKTK
jgi:DeoR family transcriptional regulator, fructose operon transcriptional repressor